MGRNKNQSITRKSVIGWAVSLTVFFCSYSPVSADKYDDAIAALKKKVSEQQAQVGALRSQADNLKNKVAILNGQINESLSHLELAEAKSQKLAIELEQAKLKLAANQVSLTNNIRTLYENGDITILEVLASSDNFSDFIDRREYLQQISDNIHKTIDETKALKQELERNQVEQNDLIAKQKSLQYSLGYQRSEVSSLLTQTQGQESLYQSQVKANNAKIDELKKAQAAAIAAQSRGSKYGGTGGYPWAGYSMTNGGADPWGFYYRQCTSFAAWRRANIGRAIPDWGHRGIAHAKFWVTDGYAYDWNGNRVYVPGRYAQNSGYRVDHIPEVGAVAIFTTGEYGHAMVVERVDARGVYVSQYNADWNGNYSESYVNPATTYFIH